MIDEKIIKRFTKFNIGDKVEVEHEEKELIYTMCGYHSRSRTKVVQGEIKSITQTLNWTSKGFKVKSLYEIWIPDLQLYKSYDTDSRFKKIK